MLLDIDGVLVDEWTPGATSLQTLWLSGPPDRARARGTAATPPWRACWTLRRSETALSTARELTRGRQRGYGEYRVEEISHGEGYPQVLLAD